MAIEVTTTTEETFDPSLVWEDIVGEKTVDDGGYVGDLMTVARAHINDAKSKGELTAQEAGEVYAAMIPSAFQNGIKYITDASLINAKLKIEEENLAKIAAEIKLIEAKTALTGTQDEVAQDSLLTAAKQRDAIDSDISLNTARIATEQDNLTTAAKQREKLDADIALLDKKELTEVEQAEFVGNNAAKVLSELDLVVQQKTTEVAKGNLITKQADNEVRKKQSFDDNMMMEMVKQQGGVASFAVNAGADDAGATVGDLHVMMDVVTDRAITVVNGVAH